ncbi:ompA family protein [Neorickettsia helminthoeca str. Oregon]|uniref:OmpA family protein n=1 Tax=Neorickettsia helminthoeca str. Oregon TaxID=1286528 RepID=X5HKZ1_9RICK|nr:OmpA family protein [Neorickettsia helminthoeca]AHX11764.1 ompA family protein [Neorickettsia helminthoeca str. Oregon]
MYKVSSVALLSVLLLMSGCFKKGSGSFKSKGGKSYHASRHLDAYCYCPPKQGTIGITHFEFDSSEVLPEAMALIDEHIRDCVAMRMKDDPEVKVLVTGHADKRGTQEYNLALGSRRANATKSYLLKSLLNQSGASVEASTATEVSSGEVTEGTAVQSETNLSERFCLNSKGKAELVDEGETEEAHSKNRRTVIEFVRECN